MRGDQSGCDGSNDGKVSGTNATIETRREAVVAEDVASVVGGTVVSWSNAHVSEDETDSE